MINSALYCGKVTHCRHVPKKHQFAYQIFLFWLDLDEQAQIEQQIRGISQSRFAPVRFKRSDYLGDPQQPLKQAVLQRMSELAGHSLQGKVFMLGQARMFGCYFSPVNFYYLQQPDGSFSHLLAEVSNTPWNQRHHYLVDLHQQRPSDKAFHVSPFNPMDMQYHWRIAQPGEQLRLLLSCRKQARHFDAGLALQRLPLTSGNLLKQLCRIPSMSIKTVLGIYWQALKLFVKGMPFYSYPNKEST